MSRSYISALNCGQISIASNFPDNTLGRIKPCETLITQYIGQFDDRTIKYVGQVQIGAIGRTGLKLLLKVEQLGREKLKKW